MAQGTNGALLALGVVGAVAAAGAVMGGRGSKATRSKKFVGEAGNYAWAIQVPGVDPHDLTSGNFGRSIDAARAVRDWKESGVKSDWIYTKPRKGQKPMPQLRKWLAAVQPSEYYAKWDLRDHDDTRQIFYKP